MVDLALESSNDKLARNVPALLAHFIQLSNDSPWEYKVAGIATISSSFFRSNSFLKSPSGSGSFMVPWVGSLPRDSRKGSAEKAK